MLHPVFVVKGGWKEKDGVRGGEREKGDYGDKKGILQGDLNRIRIKRGIKKDIMKRERERVRECWEKTGI